MSTNTMLNDKLKIWLSYLIINVFIALVLFLSAGTIHYWQAWIYLVLNAIFSALLIIFIIQDPALLERRTTAGPAAEQRPIQRVIVVCTGIPAIATFIVPGLDRRFAWSSMPPWLSILGDVLLVLSFWMVYRVFKENAFGASTVRIVEGQKVISTGPYAIVRNPMYSSATLYFLAMSLALGSYWALIPAILTILGLVWRLSDEETYLVENLQGYKEYCAKVRWHLIPGIF
jgi:protein-S-isoprenylcysteine O-methyltransferase Ste14